MTRYQIKFLIFKQKKHLKRYSRIIFWFLTGGFLALFFFSSFIFLSFQKIYENKIYPGIVVDNVNFGGKTKEEVGNYFALKNEKIKNTQFTLVSNYETATISASQVNYGYDKDLLSTQAFLIGRSANVFSNISLILQAYTGGVYLPPSYSLDRDKLVNLILPLSLKINKQPINALFTFENGRVTAFRPSENGQQVDEDVLENLLLSKATSITVAKKPQNATIQIPIKTLEPEITTDKVNDMGINELIGEGNSLFYHSIQSRIHNIGIGATRLNGILVTPGEIFSFDQALGDVSALTGYQQAYIIQNGRTVLGDGGGICQVSTTFFRALLNAGLPIVERHAHAYRVGYYEEDSPPGLDATIYVPTVDLKFKNDTGHYILIQSTVDYNNLALTFDLYGTKDGRQSIISKPVITNQTPPPPDLYQDDPTLPKGQIKQTDFAAWGADVYFTRQVIKNGKTIISDKFVSNYQPWQAIYLRGTM
jgi:vancomycin resistance protein YoaR